MLYHLSGSIAFIMCLLLLAKFFERISNNECINAWLGKIHKPLGIAVIGLGAIHGILSIEHSQNFAANFSGIILWLLTVLLAMTYYVQNKLNSKWVNVHRYLAILLIAVLILHVIVSITFTVHN